MVLKNTMKMLLMFRPLLTAIINRNRPMLMRGRKKSLRVNMGVFKCSDMSKDAIIGKLAIGI